MGLVKHWHSLPGEVVESPFLENTKLDWHSPEESIAVDPVLSRR